MVLMGQLPNCIMEPGVENFFDLEHSLERFAFLLLVIPILLRLQSPVLTTAR